MPPFPRETKKHQGNQKNHYRHQGVSFERDCIYKLPEFWQDQGTGNGGTTIESADQAVGNLEFLNQKRNIQCQKKSLTKTGERRHHGPKSDHYLVFSDKLKIIQYWAEWIRFRFLRILIDNFVFAPKEEIFRIIDIRPIFTQM